MRKNVRKGTHRFGRDLSYDEKHKICELLVAGKSYRELAEVFNVKACTIIQVRKEMHEVYIDSLRERIRKYIGENPLHGPSTTAKETRIDPKIIRAHCSDLFHPMRIRIANSRLHLIDLDCSFKRIDETVEYNASFMALRLLLLGIAEDDIASMLHVSHQAVYYVRANAIQCGFIEL